MTAQRRTGAARRSIVVGPSALGLAALALSACFAEVPAARPGWTPQEIDLQRLCAGGQAPACGALGRSLVSHASSEKDVDRGVVLLESSCADGDAASCLALGGEYRDRGDDKALARATDLLARACDLKSAEGCLELGAVYKALESQDARPALDAYRRACELGYPRGCVFYAFAQRRQARDDPRVGNAALIRACDLGDVATCYLVGRSLIDDGATRAEGVAYMGKACEGGFAQSCARLAELFAPMVGAAASWAQALPVAARACGHQDDDGCAIADACRIEANQDRPAATERLRAACDRGISLACFYWANATGKSGADPESVKRSYGLACEGHSPAKALACTRVAVLALAAVTTAEGAEVLRSRLERACERSVGEACCTLADVYAADRFSPADGVMASELRTKACNLGAQECCRP